MMSRQTPTPQSKLRDLAAIVGALAALAWPIAVVLIRVRRLRLRIGSAVLEVESPPVTPSITRASIP
jgi:hypothetical protein